MMKKYGVAIHEPTPNEKRASAGAPKCPGCGSVLNERQLERRHCPRCGSEPWERAVVAGG